MDAPRHSVGSNICNANVVSPRVSLAAVFSPDAILLGLNVRTKQDAIERMVRQLRNLTGFGESDEATIAQTILAREHTGTTGIGNGVAFPHCRSGAVDKCLGVLALDSAGIPFDALDNKLVHSIFLLVSPIGNDTHYEVLGRIAAIGKDKSQCMRLHGCRTRDDAYQFLCDLDR